MKKEINLIRLLILLAVGFAVVVCIYFLFWGSRADYSKLTEVRIRQVGTLLPSGDEYSLEQKDGVWIASHNQIEQLADHITETTVDENFVYELTEVLKKNRVHKWDDFNLKYEIKKLLTGVSTDGTNYYFYMCFSNGDTTTIKEYNIYPKTYKIVFEEFEKRYAQLFGE